MDTEYFKFTNGDAFTLDNVDYVGDFHVIEGVAYTNKIHSDASVELTPKNTYLTDMYLLGEQIGRALSDITILKPVNIEPMVTIDSNELIKTLRILDYNNRQIYSTKFVAPKNELTLNMDYTTAIDGIYGDSTPATTMFYGASSSPRDIREPDDIVTLKTGQIHIDPFSYIPEWAFLDDVISSSITIVDDDSFRYRVVTDTNSYLLSGTLTLGSPLVLLSSSDDVSEKDEDVNYGGSRIVTDEDRDVVYVIDNNSIVTADLATYKSCDNLIKIDENVFEDGIEDIDLVSIGGDIMTRGIDLDYDGYPTRLEITKLSTGSVIKNLSKADLDVDKIITFDVRTVDGYIIVLTEKAKDTIVKVIDPALLIVNDPEYIVYSTIMESAVVSDKNTAIMFSVKDSNIFYIINSSNIQIRYVNNATNVISGLDVSEDLRFLDDYIFNTTDERFDKIQIKFNSNIMKSNYPNLLTSTFTLKNNTMFIVLHFIGRIFILKLDYGISTDEVNTRTVTLGTDPYDSEVAVYEKHYDESKVRMCNNTYIGLNLNMLIRSVLNDTVEIYNNYTKVAYWNRVGPPALNDYRDRAYSHEYSVSDLNIHTNESVNIVTLRRLIKSLYDIQKNLIEDINSSAIL